MSSLGIIAGGGALPRAVAQSAGEDGRRIFVVALRGSAERDMEEFPHAWVSPGEAGKLLRLLREHDCVDVLFAGRVMRPRFSELKPDAKGILLLPRIAAAAREGDDALLRAFVDILADEGFHPIGVADAAPGLLAAQGLLGRAKPGSRDERDIVAGQEVVRRLGALDVGQAAIICAGLVLAVEAAEGTDAMILRVCELPATIRGSSEHRRGVLVKALKPTQDGKTDLPVIGANTVANAAAAGLAGIAVEAHRTLILDRRSVIAAADAAGMFLLGFAPSAQAELQTS